MTVNKDDDFEKIRDFAVKFGEQLAEQSELVPDILSSPEIIGGMGMNEVLVKEEESAERAEELAEFGEEIAAKARESKSYEELLETFVEVSEDFWGPVTVDPEAPDEIKEKHIGLQYWIYGTGMVSTLDDMAGTENADVILEFINDLEEQEYLSETSSAVFLFLAKDEDYLLKFGNQFTRKVQSLVEQVEKYGNHDERDLDALIKMGEECGPLVETAIPPAIMIIHFLETGELHFDRAEDMNLRDSIDYIRGFEPLAPIGEAFNVDYRNAFHHGGKTGGCTPNYLRSNVRLEYQKGGEIRSETLDGEAFEEVVLQMVSVVVSLFLLPFFIITGHTTAEIELTGE